MKYKKNNELSNNLKTFHLRYVSKYMMSLFSKEICVKG